jgi:hypothetical protein
MRRTLAPGIALTILLSLAPPVGAAGRQPRAVRPRLADPVACPGCWEPALQTSWQWQLQGEIDTSFDVGMYDVDGFETSESTVQELQAGGAAVVCYISAGSWENFRPDHKKFPDRVLGESNGWRGERWLDIRRLSALRPIMNARMDRCANKGFDAIEFDNVDGYKNDSGFPLHGPDQLRYNVFLANGAHRRGLSAVLKNDLGQVDALLPYFDVALNEQCHQYRECDKLDPFVDAGKAVFGVEYKLAVDEFCQRANNHDFNFLIKGLALRALPRTPCRGA